jgi:hypothetical protein
MGSFLQGKPTTNSTQLEEIEARFLLQFIASSTFKGENVKILYNIVEKLEKQLHG